MRSLDKYSNFIKHIRYYLVINIWTTSFKQCPWEILKLATLKTFFF